MLNHDLLFSVPCCFLLDRLIKEATCNVMVDHLQSRVTPWRQYANHVKVRGTLSKMDVTVLKKNYSNSDWSSLNDQSLSVDDHFNNFMLKTSSCVDSRVLRLHSLRLLSKRNTWNKYSELHLFQFKWNRNHSIPE